MIAVVLGLVFWVGGWHLPAAINYCVKSLNSICSPLALLLCGMVIGEYDFKKLLHLEYLVLPLLRTVAMPALLFGVSRLLLLAGVDELLCNMMVVYGALPTSSLLPVYAMKYDPDPENHLRAAGVSMISVLMSAFTIPVWYLLLH
jgi:predicted permease